MWEEKSGKDEHLEVAVKDEEDATAESDVEGMNAVEWFMWLSK